MKIHSMFFLVFATFQLYATQYDRYSSFARAFRDISENRKDTIVASAHNSRDKMFQAIVGFLSSKTYDDTIKTDHKELIGLCVDVPNRKMTMGLETFSPKQSKWDDQSDWIECRDSDTIARGIEAIANKEKLAFIIFNITANVANDSNIELIKQFQQNKIPLLVNLDTNCDIQFREKIINQLGKNVKCYHDVVLSKGYNRTRVIGRVLGITFFIGSLVFFYCKFIRR